MDVIFLVSVAAQQLKWPRCTIRNLLVLGSFFPPHRDHCVVEPHVTLARVSEVLLKWLQVMLHKLSP
jgi:hypothetical protein